MSPSLTLKADLSYAQFLLLAIIASFKANLLVQQVAFSAKDDEAAFLRCNARMHCRRLHGHGVFRNQCARILHPFNQPLKRRHISTGVLGVWKQRPGLFVTEPARKPIGINHPNSNTVLVFIDR
jgi:hypothetical protein